MHRNNSIRNKIKRRVGIKHKKQVPRGRIAKPKPELFNPLYEIPNSIMPSDIIDTEVKENDTNPLCWPDFAKPIYVISIRGNRMNNFLKRMGPWAQYCRRLPCADGRFINRQIIHNSGLSAGQVGAALSHIRVWKSIAEGFYPQCTVFEDDVDLHYTGNGEAIVSRMRQSIKELEDNSMEWEFIAWGHGPWAEKHNKSIPNLKHWKTPGYVQGFFAYTIKKTLAERLVKQALPLRLAIDVWFYSMVQKGKVKCLTLHPSLFFVVPGPSETSHMLP